jgi:hypothetical protein
MEKDSENLKRHFKILAKFYKKQEEAAKSKLAHLEAAKIRMEHQIQKNCQHVDDGGMLFGHCKKCGINLG